MSVDKDLVSVQQARDLVEAAYRAQAEVAAFEQAKIDRICEAMANAALADAARLGAMAVEETGYGVPADKQEKNRFAAEDVWNYFRGLRTKGVVSETKDVVEIASPRGVVAGIIPSTNPTSTAIFKILIAIKSRNTVVLSPHPSAAKCINETARVMRDAGVKEGLPADAIGCMSTGCVRSGRSADFLQPGQGRVPLGCVASLDVDDAVTFDEGQLDDRYLDSDTRSRSSRPRSAGGPITQRRPVAFACSDRRRATSCCRVEQIRTSPSRKKGRPHRRSVRRVHHGSPRRDEQHAPR